ncbi:MAG: SDR family oxidoreductase, partial [Acidobacteriota bacterium]
SRGIGAATARLAAQRGYDICLTYHSRADEAAAVVAEIEQLGRKGLAVRVDVAEEADVLRLFDTVDDAFGRPDALVNNAGILELQQRVEAMSADRLARVFAVNVTGAFLCAREAIRRMSNRRGGRGGAIVNVSSSAARLGAPNEYVDYAASKGAIDTFTVGLAKEVVGEGIRVNAVRPGPVHTEIHASGGEPNRIERVKKAIPMGRGGEPEEVAQAILWLLSEEASYSAGAFIEVSGGL